MKATVYYDTNGIIQSVVSVDPNAQTIIHNDEYQAVEIELKGNKPNLLSEIHLQFRVDTVRRKLIRRSNTSRKRKNVVS